MNMQQTQQELQKFADANGMNIDIQKMLDTMDAGDFIELNSAMDQSDNNAIMKIMHKYKARLSENFKHFNSMSTDKPHSVSLIENMNSTELNEAFQKCSFGTFDTSHLSLSELRTLIYEDMAPNLKSVGSSSVNASDIQKPQDTTKLNPAQAAQMKQSELEKNIGNPNFKVQTPGNGGTAGIAGVVGIQPSQDKQDTLVVTHDPNSPAGAVNIFDIDDISTIDQNQMQESENFFNELLESIPELDECEECDEFSNDLGHQSVLAAQEPTMRDLINSITTVNQEITDGSESVVGNEPMDYQDELDEIMKFCRNMDL